MEIEYDKEADAVYIRLRQGNFSKNEKIDESTIADFDEKGQILGFELLDVSKTHPDSISNLKLTNILPRAH